MQQLTIIIDIYLTPIRQLYQPYKLQRFFPLMLCPVVPMTHSARYPHGPWSVESNRKSQQTLLRLSLEHCVIFMSASCHNQIKSNSQSSIAKSRKTVTTSSARDKFDSKVRGLQSTNVISSGQWRSKKPTRAQQVTKAKPKQSRTRPGRSQDGGGTVRCIDDGDGVGKQGEGERGFENYLRTHIYHKYA